MRRRAFWAAVSVQSGRRASFLRRVARAFTDHPIRGDHSCVTQLSAWAMRLRLYGVNVEQTSTVLSAW